MTEYTEMFHKLKFVHVIIGIILFIVLICLHIGFRPLCLLATFALITFLFDYAMDPYQFGLIFYALAQWMPVLVEMSLFYGTVLVTRFLNFLQPWHAILLLVCIARSAVVVYHRLLPIDDAHRVLIEKNLEKFFTLFQREFSLLLNRLLKMCNTVNEEEEEDNEIDRFKLEQINSVDSVINEHDETIQRLQKIAAASELTSPIVANIECSSTATPPVRRHHARVLNQNDGELEPPRTPITPAHPSSSMAKMLHIATGGGSYTGPMTRNRARTETTSPIKSKLQTTEFTFLVCKRDEEKAQ